MATFPELKPCPFCGAEACFAAEHENRGPAGVSVFCIRCNLAFLEPGNIFTVAELWNRRTEPGEPQSGIYNRVWEAMAREPATVQRASERIFELWREELVKLMGPAKD